MLIQVCDSLHSHSSVKNMAEPSTYLHTLPGWSTATEAKGDLSEAMAPAPRLSEDLLRSTLTEAGTAEPATAADALRCIRDKPLRAVWVSALERLAAAAAAAFTAIDLLVGSLVLKRNTTVYLASWETTQNTVYGLFPDSNGNIFSRQHC